MRSLIPGRPIGAWLAAGFAVALLATAVRADVPQRFDYIPKRNVFGLKPAPQPEARPEQPQPEKPAVLLTGITTILGDKRALFKSRPPQGQPAPAPGAEQSFILSEGQREGPIEVLRIDENAGAVSVNLNGDRRTLTLERDGPSLPSGGAGSDTNSPGATAASGPGVPTFNVGTAPAPGSPPMPPGAGGNNRTMPTRMPRIPQTGSATSAVYATNFPPPLSPSHSYTAQPQPNPAITPPLPPGLPQTERPRLTPEEQQVLIELQRLEAESRAR